MDFEYKFGLRQKIPLPRGFTNVSTFIFHHMAKVPAIYKKTKKNMHTFYSNLDKTFSRHGSRFAGNQDIEQRLFLS